MIRKLTLSVGAGILSLGLTLGGAHAAGNSYGCQINPNQSQCQNPPSAAVVGGSAQGVQGSTSVTTLPTTGGAVPTGGADLSGIAGAGLALLLAGFAVRRRV